MIEQYFSAPKTLRHVRSAPCGAYVDGFVESLQRDGYTPMSIRRSLRAATHLGVFLTRRRQSAADLDAATLDAFGRHLLHCRCRPSSGRRTGYHGRFGAQRFHLESWDRGIQRKLQTLESIYGKITDRVASRRLELLEWIIIVLIAISIVLPFVPGVYPH